MYCSVGWCSVVTCSEVHCPIWLADSGADGGSSRKFPVKTWIFWNSYLRFLQKLDYFREYWTNLCKEKEKNICSTTLYIRDKTGIIICKPKCHLKIVQIDIMRGMILLIIENFFYCRFNTYLYELSQVNRLKSSSNRYKYIVLGFFLLNKRLYSAILTIRRIGIFLELFH